MKKKNKHWPHRLCCNIDNNNRSARSDSFLRFYHFIRHAFYKKYSNELNARPRAHGNRVNVVCRCSRLRNTIVRWPRRKCDVKRRPGEKKKNNTIFRLCESTAASNGFEYTPAGTFWIRNYVFGMFQGDYISRFFTIPTSQFYTAFNFLFLNRIRPFICTPHIYYSTAIARRNGIWLH